MDAIILCQTIKGRSDELWSDLQQLDGALSQDFFRDIHMTLVDRFVQGEHDASFDAGRMIHWKSERAGDAVGGFETDPVDVAFELVWILLNGFK